MKKLTLLIAVLILASACVSSKMVTSPAPMSQNVVTDDEQNTNYIKANEWMVENFNNAESVIQFSDKEAGIIKGKYLMKQGFYQAGSQYTPEVKTDDIYAVITIRVKDARSRIEIALTKDSYAMVEYAGTVITPSPEELKIMGKALMDDFYNHMTSSSANAGW